MVMIDFHRFKPISSQEKASARLIYFTEVSWVNATKVKLLTSRRASIRGENFVMHIQKLMFVKVGIYVIHQLICSIDSFGGFHG